MLPHPDQHAGVHEPGFAGLFDAHVTVEARGAEDLDRFRTTCTGWGLKCVLIELLRGASRSQPMVNRVSRGTLSEARRDAGELARRLARNGFPVLRVKIEAALENQGIPETDDQARQLDAGNYFEYHVKLRLPGAEAVESVRAACLPHGAHLSSNAFRRLDAGGFERFVTLRCAGVGRRSADARMTALRTALDATGYPLVKVVGEYCVLDSNLALDNGWLDPS